MITIPSRFDSSSYLCIDPQRSTNCINSSKVCGSKLFNNTLYASFLASGIHTPHLLCFEEIADTLKTFIKTWIRCTINWIGLLGFCACRNRCHHFLAFSRAPAPSLFSMFSFRFLMALSLAILKLSEIHQWALFLSSSVVATSIVAWYHVTEKQDLLLS